MKVVRQDHNRIDRKGALMPGYAKRRAKPAHMVDENRRPAFRQR